MNALDWLSLVLAIALLVSLAFGAWVLAVILAVLVFVAVGTSEVSRGATLRRVLAEHDRWVAEDRAARQDSSEDET